MLASSTVLSAISEECEDRNKASINEETHGAIKTTRESGEASAV